MAIDYNFEPKGHRSELGWYDRGYIPHFDGGPIPQFITFRLFDALPKRVVVELEEKAKALGDDSGAIFRKSLEKYLDSSYGECFLARPAIAQMVVEALNFHKDKKYRLHAWVIMPNHGHILATPLPAVELRKIAHSIKSYTAHEANKMLGRTGQFWQHEIFDRYIRNREHFLNVIEYIENNPVKAGLCRVASDWRYSSAGS